MADTRRAVLYRLTFALAAVYNVAFGLWAGLWPHAFFELFELEPPRYPSLWACLPPHLPVDRAQRRDLVGAVRAVPREW